MTKGKSLLDYPGEGIEGFAMGVQNVGSVIVDIFSVVFGGGTMVTVMLLLSPIWLTGLLLKMAFPKLDWRIPTWRT